MTFDQTVAEMLVKITNDPSFATKHGLEQALRLLAKWRSQLIDNTVVNMLGTTIQAGPFKGMEFVARASEANVSPRLLGSYESELHPIIEEICSSDYECLIDIGCADGYYAVGFACRMPSLKVYAFDINLIAQQQCSDLALRNGISSRIEVGGEFSGENFSIYGGRRALVFLDAEGAEDELLRPDLYAGLVNLAVLVECHDVFKPGISKKIAERFASTHEIRRVEPSLPYSKLPDWFGQLSHLDQLLAIWEWRMGPTPWLYMVPRADLGLDNTNAAHTGK